MKEEYYDQLIIGKGEDVESKRKRRGSVCGWRSLTASSD